MSILRINRRGATLRVLPWLVVTTLRNGPHPWTSAFQPFALNRRLYSTDCHLGRRKTSDHRRKRNVSCNLFFRKTDKNPAPRPKSIDPTNFARLQSANISLPFEISFADDNYDYANEGSDESLVIRFMQPDDIQSIMPLCIEEFGTGASLSPLDFPFHNLSRISDWWDRVYFEPMVTVSLLAKMNKNLDSKEEAEDPAILVLCRKRLHEKHDAKTEQVVGMVELSLQEPDANRNPPPFPVPLWIKSLSCLLAGTRIQGWVTNLLIDPRCRGLGYAKILMAATEGIARSWRCKYVYLHVDADFQSGKVAQSLYKGLGYEVVTDQSPEYAWMTEGGNPFSSIRMVEGVPLLCLYKHL